MKRSILCILVLAFALTASATAVSAQSVPTFKLGFKALADQIPDVVGVPLENEHFNLSNGNSEQHTTTGLMVWRKADNWTAFTNGYMTWINGPNGVQSRLNTQRFPWEKDAGATSPSPSSPGVPTFNRSNWQDLQNGANGLKGRQLEVRGRLFTNLRTTPDGRYDFQLWLDPSSDQGNVEVVATNVPSGLKDNDFVAVSGVCMGTGSGSNFFGSTINFVLLTANDGPDAVRIVTRGEAVAPTIKLVQVGQTVEKSGVAVTLDKIEIAADETRVFVTIKNGSPTGIDLYNFDANLSGGTKQPKLLDNSGTGYPEIPSPIMPGVQLSTVLLFGPIDPSGSIKLWWQGSFGSNPLFQWQIAN